VLHNDIWPLAGVSVRTLLDTHDTLLSLVIVVFIRLFLRIDLKLVARIVTEFWIICILECFTVTELPKRRVINEIGIVYNVICVGQ
jgi:hypothetical protein